MEATLSHQGSLFQQRHRELACFLNSGDCVSGRRGTPYIHPGNQISTKSGTYGCLTSFECSAAPSSLATITVPAFVPFLAEALVFAFPNLLKVLAVLLHYL